MYGNISLKKNTGRLYFIYFIVFHNKFYETNYHWKQQPENVTVDRRKKTDVAGKEKIIKGDTSMIKNRPQKESEKQ